MSLLEKAFQVAKNAGTVAVDGLAKKADEVRQSQSESMSREEILQKSVQVAKDVGTVAAHGILSAIAQKASEIRKLQGKSGAMSDDELIRTVNSEGFFGAGSTEKGVALRELKNRGYNPENLR